MILIHDIIEILLMKNKLTKPEIFCIYNANGGFIGELSYFIKKYIKGFNCAMCDITHNKIRIKGEWKRKQAEFDYDLKALHLDEQPEMLHDFTKNKAPCVIGITNNKLQLLISDEELRAINGDVNLFFEKLNYTIRNIYNPKG
tara:strand:- start:45 stop:473 length:429 start_codon:yes stop_codon:yes gene_type:complete